MTRQIWHEVSIWSSVSTHPNIVALLGITMYGKQVVTLSEYCDEGSLYDANLRHLRHSMASPLDLVDVSLAPAEVAQRPAVQLVAWVEGLASALSYLHALTPTPVMHRNLKSSNCMLSHGGAKLRLTDFTTACLAFPAADLTPRMGSVRWMAPEVLTDRPYGPPADMYGFGMVCYEMVSYQVPFADCTIAQACVKASAGERPPIPKGCPEWLQTLMLAAWRPEPEVRPDFASTHKTLSALKKATLTTSAGNVGRGSIPFLSATLGALTASPSALLARTPARHLDGSVGRGSTGASGCFDGWHAVGGTACDSRECLTLGLPRCYARLVAEPHRCYHVASAPLDRLARSNVAVGATDTSKS